MNRRSTHRRRRGFTLLEVLLVLAILVILGSLAVVTLTNVQSDAESKAAKVQVSSFDEAIDLYRFHVRQYPSTSVGLQALRQAPGDLPNPDRWKGPYIDNIPVDPWDRPYQYAQPGRHNADRFDVWSLGPDGADGTEDDVGNWEVTQQ